MSPAPLPSHARLLPVLRGDVEPGSPASGPRAAVAVVLAPDRRGDSELLLIRRAARSTDPWSGQVGLPGGRAGEDDSHLLETASRETSEEVGLTLPASCCIRSLPPVGALRRGTIEDLRIHPFVFAVDGWPELRIDPREVAQARPFPLPWLFDPARAATVFRPENPAGPGLPAIRLDESWLLWGLTYRILDQLAAILRLPLAAGPSHSI